MTRTLMQGLLAATILIATPLAASAQGRPQLTPEQQAERLKAQAAEEAEWNVVKAPEDPKDFSGVYWTRGYDRTYRQLDRSLPPFNDAERKDWQRHLDAEKAGAPIADAPTQCFPHGVPRLIASPYPIRFVHTPNEIWMLHEVGHNVRVIHLDKTAPPPNTPLTFLGYSVGHWEGDTLVVETTHLNDRTRIDEEAISHGTKLKVTERIKKIKNQFGNTELDDLITIEDPDHFTAPWTARRTFPWRGDIQVTEYSCEENNRNAPGADGVTVAK